MGLCFDYKQNGVGSNCCGPELHENIGLMRMWFCLRWI